MDAVDGEKTYSFIHYENSGGYFVVIGFQSIAVDSISI